MASSLPNTMKEARVSSSSPSSSITASIHTIPVPEPAADQILIKVHTSGSNPKDWKFPARLPKFNHTNSGDDIAGTVVAIGTSTTGFSVGDRVAAFHQMLTPGGSFAEYALAPYYTTFHLPSQVSFEEGATIPLAAMTAAVGLFVRLGLPEPWVGENHPEKKPKGGVLIYGAASAVGAYAVKLLRRAGVHPILCVAGQGVEFVKGLIDASEGDVVVDYRQGDQHVVEGIKAAIPKGEKLHYAFDCVSEKGKSLHNVVAVLEHAQESHMTTVLPVDAGKDGIPGMIELSRTAVGSVHAEAKDFGFAWFKLFGLGLVDGWFTPHPFEVVTGGLGGVEEGLRRLQEGRTSARKWVFRIGETEGAAKL